MSSQKKTEEGVVSVRNYLRIVFPLKLPSFNFIFLTTDITVSCDSHDYLCLKDYYTVSVV